MPIRISAAALCHTGLQNSTLFSILCDRYEYNNNVLLRILQILNTSSESEYRTNHLCLQNLIFRGLLSMPQRVLYHQYSNVGLITKPLLIVALGPGYPSYLIQ